MMENAQEYLLKKFELANNCLKKNIEYNKQHKNFNLDSMSEDAYYSWLNERENAVRNIWSPLFEYQKEHPKEPNYYIKKGSFYSRVYFTPGVENVTHFKTSDKIPERFIKNQVKIDPWSVVINQDFINRYSLLHLIWFLSIMRTRRPGEHSECNDPLKDFEFPDYVPKCKHCGSHFTKHEPNQKYCNNCQATVKEWGFNPMFDKDSHRYCLNCGEHLPNGKHKKAKFCNGACRTAYFRKKRKEEFKEK